jgi:hypothetical protein
MVSKIFNDFSRRAINAYVNSKVFYAVLVTVEPAIEALTVSELIQPLSTVNYAPKLLTNVTTVLNGNIAKIQTDNVVWNGISTNGTVVIGVVFCERLGAAFASTDAVSSFHQFQNPVTPNGSDLTVAIDPSNGLIRGLPGG